MDTTRLRIRELTTWAGVTACILLSGTAFGQDAAEGDALVDLAGGVKSYIVGIAEADRPSLEAAIGQLSAALEADPSSQPALLFRALAHGELGYLSRGDKVRADANVKEVRFLIDWRSNPEKEQELIAERDGLQAQVDDPGVLGAQRLILRSRLESVERTLNNLQVEKTQVASTVEQLEEDLQGHLAEFYRYGSTERGSYEKMMADIERLVSLWDKPDAVVGLLDAVSTAKVGRSFEEEALGVAKKELSPQQAAGSLSDLRRRTKLLSDKAARVLESVLSELPESDTLTRVRAEFFLGVIRFRQGVPRRDTQSGNENQVIDRSRLAQAEQIMRRIATLEENGQLRNWRSYAALYLGLIIPFRAGETTNAEERETVLDEAQHWLSESARLDARDTDPTDPRSASQNTIPELVWEQRKELEEFRTRAPAERPLRRDFSISTFVGVHRDTNVVLLGERTDLPRDISRDSDYAFSAGTNLDFTWDVNDRFTVGLQGRVSQLWNVDVDEFDEQNYGGSVALQYEVIPKSGSFGPLQLHLQYDFDYTLLGREGFLTSNTITPSLRVYWADQRAQTEVYFRYQLRDYSEPLSNVRLDRDGEYLALGFSQSVKTIDMAAWYERNGIAPWGLAGDGALEQTEPDYPHRYLQPYFLFEYSWDQTSGTEFDLKAILFAVGARVPLPWGIDMDASVDFEWEDYRNGSIIDFHRRSRRDFIQRYQVAFSRTFVLQAGQLENRFRPEMDRILMTLRAHAAWTHDDSNVVDRLGRSVFQYDRTVYGLSVAFTFN